MSDDDALLKHHISESNRRFDRVEQKFDQIDKKLDALAAFKWKIIGASSLALFLIESIKTIIGLKSK